MGGGLRAGAALLRLHDDGLAPLLPRSRHHRLPLVLVVRVENLRRGQGGLALPLHGAGSTLPEDRGERMPVRALKRAGQAGTAPLANAVSAHLRRFFQGAGPPRWTGSARASGRVRLGSTIVALE